eukprot:g10572.t1
MSTTGAPSLASLTRNSSKKQQLTRIFDEFVDREFRNDDELPEDLELLVELANGGLQPRQKWVPVSKSHASHSLLAATDSTTTGRGLAKGPARSASPPPPGRRLGGYLRKMTPMDIHCINLYLRKKMQLLRAEKERDLISRVEEEARRCQYALQRQQTNEKDHVLMLERKIAEKEREMDSLQQQRDEAFVEVDQAKQEIRDYDKKHRQDLKEVEKLAKAELQKVRDQFAKEDSERTAELEERLAWNKAELEEREKLLGDYVGRADELRNMMEKMEAEKQFADAEAAKKVDSMKNLIGQDTSASFQCQKYFFLLWRFSVLGDQRDKAQESFQRLVMLNEQRMQNLMGMFSSSRESTDPGEYFRRWKVYTEKHAGERRQLRITEKQSLQVVDLILSAKHTEWKVGFFQKLNRGRLAAKWRQRIFRLWEKRGVKSVLGEWKNAVTEERRLKQLRRIRAQNRRAFDDSKTCSTTSGAGSPSKRKEIFGEQESPAGSDNDGRRTTDERVGGILAKTAEFCDQRYYFQAWRFAKCEDERERVTASWQHLVALNEKKLESLTAVFATSGKVDIGQSFRRWRNFTRENFRERSKAMIVISKRRVAYEMVFHNWRFMMELERERERQIEGVKALKAGQKAVFASLFGSHWDSYEQALTAQYFNLWLGETKDAHKRDREKKLQIQKELAHKRLAAFQTGLSGANQLLLSGSFNHWQKTASGLKQSQQMANALSQKAEIQEFLSGSLKKREELFVMRSCFRLWHVLEVEGRREQKEREKKLLASAAANRNRLALKFTTESNKNVLQVMWNSWKTFVANAKQSKERLAFKEKVGQNMLMATNTGMLTEIFRTWARDTRETISARNKAAEDAERTSELAKLRAKQDRAAQERVQRVALMVGTKCDDFNKGLVKSTFYAWSVEVQKLAKFKKHRRTNVSKTLEKNFSQSLQQTTFYGWKILAKRTRNLKSRDSAVGIMIHSHDSFLVKDLVDVWRQVTADEKRIVEKQALMIKYSASCRRMCQHFTKKFDNEHMFARWLSALQKRKRRDVLASSMISKKELSGGVVAYKCFVTWRGEIELAKRGKAEVKALELEVSCAKYRRDVGRILARKWEDLQCVSLVNAFREWRKAFGIRKKTERFKTVIEMHAFVAEVRHAWAVWRYAVLRRRRIRQGLWGISLRDRNRVLGASLRAWRSHSVGVFTEIIPRLEHAWRDYTSSAGQYQKNLTHSDGDEATAVSSIAVADTSLTSTPRGAVGAGFLSHRSLSDDEAHEERSGPGSFFSRSSQSKLMSREEREGKRKLQQHLRARANSVVVDFLQRAVESSPSHARHKWSRSRNRTNVVSRPSTTLEGRTVVAHHASRSSLLIHALWQRKYETGLWFLRWRLRVLLHGKQLRQKSLLSRWGTYLNSLFVSATPHHAQKPVLQLSFYKWQLCLTRSKADRRALWAERRALKFREWNLLHLYLHNWQAAAMQERAERNAREEAARLLVAEEERILAEKKREEDECERAEKIRIEQELKIREQQQKLIRLQAEEAAADLRKRTEEEVEEQHRWADEAKHEKRLAEVQAALRKREEEVLREMELDRKLVEEEHVGMMNVMKGKVEDARGSGSTGKIPQIANLIADNVGVVVPPDYLAVPVDEARSKNRLPRAASLYKPTGTLPDVDEVLLQRYSIEELRRNEELAQLRRQADEVVRMKRAELELEKQKLRQELRVKLQKAEEEQVQHFDTERDRYVALLEMCATAKSEIASGKREVRDLEERAEALTSTAAAGGGHLLGPEGGTSSGAAAFDDDDHSSSSAIPAVIRGKRQLARELEEVEKLVAVTTARNNRKSETPGIEEAANDRRGKKNSADEQDGCGVGAFMCGPSGGGQPQEEFIYEPQPVPSFLSKTTSDGEQPFPQRPPPARASNNIAVAASVSTSAKNRASASNPFPDLLPKPVAPQLTTGLPNSSMKDLSKDSVARDKQPIPVVDTDLVGGGLGSRYNLPDRVDVVSTVENSAQTSSMRKSLRAKLEPGRDEAASSRKVGAPFVPERQALQARQDGGTWNKKKSSPCSACATKETRRNIGRYRKLLWQSEGSASSKNDYRRSSHGLQVP